MTAPIEITEDDKEPATPFVVDIEEKYENDAPTEYAVTGWFKWKINSKPHNMLFRLANTEDTTQFGARLLKARVQ